MLGIKNSSVSCFHLGLKNFIPKISVGLSEMSVRFFVCFQSFTGTKYCDLVCYVQWITSLFDLDFR